MLFSANLFSVFVRAVKERNITPRFVVSSFRAVFLVGVLASAALAQNYDADHLQALKWRHLTSPESGPAFAAVEVPGDTQVYYVASGPGGLWKTTNAGITWTSIFVGQPVASVSSIAVSESDPRIIFIGTGSSGVTLDTLGGSGDSPGNGVYKSIDAGQTWTHVGLDETHHISKIVIDPHDPNVVFVAAVGSRFAPNADRGIFRSQDGGQTWEKVLFKDDLTAAFDVAIDPQNSKILFATLTQATQTPWSFTAIGPGSGLYKSVDGGTNWLQLSGHGLPEGLLGRVSVSVSPADSNRIYAFLEAEKGGGVYRSDDAGDSWQIVNATIPSSAAAFPCVIADSKNADTVFVAGDILFRSNDGGSTLIQLENGPQQRIESLWIDPTDPQRIVVATDAGPYVSGDAGKTWNATSNLPTAQLNHLATDTRFPYYVYAAQLDGSVIALASDSATVNVDPSIHYEVGAAPGAYLSSDRTNSDLLYVVSFAGRLIRFDQHAGQTQDISPWPDSGAGAPIAILKYRFDADAPLKISAENPDTLYFAAQVLFKSSNAGASWDVISPDLTRNDKAKQQEMANTPGAPPYDVISSVAESPAQRNLIWAGTDDGLVHITRDGGIHWVSVTPRELPSWARVNSIEASWHDGGTAYVAVDAHQLDNPHPYIFRTHKFGAIWKKITNGLPQDSSVYVVREDPEHGGLLFAGTETGVYVSFNDGERWRPLALNMPAVPVHDLVIKGNDLIAATYGRGFWVLDDFSALRDFDKLPRTAVSYLFKPPPQFRVHQLNSPGISARQSAAAETVLRGATLHYWLRESLPESQPISLEILDSSGKVIAAFTDQEPPANQSAREVLPIHPPPPLTTNVGLNRFSWDMRYQSPDQLGSVGVSPGDLAGPLALPGEYQVRLTVAGEHHLQPLEIRHDPRIHTSDDDLRKQFDLETKIGALSVRSRQTALEMQKIEAQVTALQHRLEPPVEPASAAESQPQSPPSPPSIDNAPAPAPPPDSQAAGSNDQTAASAPQATPETAPPPTAQIAPQNTEATASILASTTALRKRIIVLEAPLVSHARASFADHLAEPPRFVERLSYLESAVDSSDSAPTAQEYQVADDCTKFLNDSIEDWQGIQEGDLQDLNELLTANGIDAIEVDSDATSSEPVK